ncbi:CDP-diacylglycerol--glycerol-3-phosphate 3-phosphatidyltransferase [Myxococcota bacterium]|nr:CDP-diacylglycerol--glycerol-3-phosphate 3-phosphatidyltransferase [Myxococcota bacterium]
MIWTLPNILSFSRLLTLPLILVMIWPSLETPKSCYWASAVFLIGSITDLADGYIARRFNQVTVFGQFLDPLVDKLFHIIPLLALTAFAPSRVPIWLVMIILSRELTITGLRGIAVSEGLVIDAGTGGKFKTMLAMFGMLALLIHYPYTVNFGFVSAPINFHILGLWLTYISTIFSITSGASYMARFVKALNQPKPTRETP